MTEKSQLTADHVLDIVRPYIERNQPDSYKLIIHEAWLSESLEGWVVSIDFDREGISGIDFARRLTDIQEQLEQDYPEDEIYLQTSMNRIGKQS